MNRVTVLLLIFILASSPAMVASTFAEPLISEDFESQTTLNGNYQKSGVGERHSIIKISVVDEIGIDRSVGTTDQKQNQQKPMVTRTNHLHLSAFEGIGLSDGDRKIWMLLNKVLIERHQWKEFGMLKELDSTEKT